MTGVMAVYCASTVFVPVRGGVAIEVYRWRRGSIWRLTVVGVIIAIFIASLWYTLMGIQTRLAPDPGFLSAQWVDKHAPQGSTVSFGYASACDSGFDAPIYKSEFQILEGKSGPDYLVLDYCVLERLGSADVDSLEFRFFDDVLNGTGQLYKYELMERFDPHKQVVLDMGLRRYLSIAVSGWKSSDFNCHRS